MAAASFRSAHPYYIGLTELNISTPSTLQVSVRLFANDLEEALRKASSRPVDILNPEHAAQTDSLLFHYIRKRLGIQLNGKAATLHYVGYEREEESVWTYLEIRSQKPDSIRRVSISNSLLYEAFPAQTHIIRVLRFGVMASYKLTNPKTQVHFQF